MKTRRSLIPFVLLFAMLIFQQSAHGKKDAKIEIIEPFSSWFLTERLDFYVRVSNIGDEPLRLAYIGGGDTDLFFEIDPNSRRSDGGRLILPRVESAEKRPDYGLILPPARAYVMSDADFNEAEFVNSECFTRVRVSLLLEQGSWVSSEWVERKILPAPDLNGESLYNFILDPIFEGIPNKVLPLKVGDENWLFSHHTGSPGNVGRRLCRVPDGSTVLSIHHDMKTKRLTIQFEGGEEPVVINTRTGLPVSGSERTVPHFHLWQKIAGRPYTDVYQQILERQQGRRDELDRSRSTVPALNMDESPESRQPKSEKSINEPIGSGRAADISRTETGWGADVNERFWMVFLGALIVLAFGFWIIYHRSDRGHL